jgi:hypothetical protein
LKIGGGNDLNIDIDDLLTQTSAVESELELLIVKHAEDSTALRVMLTSTEACVLHLEKDLSQFMEEKGLIPGGSQSIAALILSPTIMRRLIAEKILLQL